jgi:hypothetical protein
MLPLDDPVVLAQLRKVLSEWNCTGYVTAKESARHWVAENLAGMNLKAVAKAMHDFMASGGIVDQVKENRPEWDIWPFHYDFRLTIGGRGIYIETILQDDDPNDPTVQIVSIHDAQITGPRDGEIGAGSAISMVLPQMSTQGSPARDDSLSVRVDARRKGGRRLRSQFRCPKVWRMWRTGIRLRSGRSASPGIRCDYKAGARSARWSDLTSLDRSKQSPGAE